MHTHSYAKSKEGDVYKFCSKKGCTKRKKIVTKPKPKAQRDKCDKMWADITKKIHRKRFGNICGWCKKPSDKLQSDHIMNRWKSATRWNVHNCIVLDSVCHLFRKKREPFAWAEAVREYVGDDVLEELKKRSQEIYQPDYDVIENSLYEIERNIDTMEFEDPKPMFGKLYTEDNGPMEDLAEARQ